MKRSVAYTLIVIGLLVITGCIYLATRNTISPVPETSVSKGDTQTTSSSENTPGESRQKVADVTGTWSFTINGIQKRDRFTDVYGAYETPITMKIVDPDSGALILEVSDFTSKNTDLNNLVPSGTEYYLQFYDADGTLMEPVWPNVKTLHD